MSITYQSPSSYGKEQELGNDDYDEEIIRTDNTAEGEMLDREIEPLVFIIEDEDLDFQGLSSSDIWETYRSNISVGDTG